MALDFKSGKWYIEAISVFTYAIYILLNFGTIYFLYSGAGIAGAVANEKIMSLEQKIYRLQEELTEQHRNRGEVSG